MTTAWGIKNCKELDLADELTLELLVRLRKKYPNDQDFGSEVDALLKRLTKALD